MRQRSRKKGYALVSIIVIGLFAILFMLALAGMLLSLARSEAVTKQKSNLLDAAEIGLDYAVSNLNEALETGNQSLFEVSDSLPEKVVTLPSSYLPGGGNTTVKIKVRKLTGAERLVHSSFGVLYCPQMEPLEAVSTQYPDPVRSMNLVDYGRIVEVSAQRGVFHKSIRAVLEPRLEAPPGGAGNFSGSPTALFPGSAVFAVTNLSLKPTGNLQLNSLGTSTTSSGSESQFTLKMQSNQSASLSGNTTLTGDLLVTNNSTGAPNNVVQLSDNANIDGRLFTNNTSNSSVQSTPGAQPTGSDNVDALADIASGQSSNRVGANDSSPTVFNSGESPVNPSPVPTANLASVDTTGDGTADTTNQFDSFLASIDSGGSSIDLNHGTVPGTSTEVNSYSTSQIDTSAPGARAVNISSSNLNATKIFVDGSNTADAVKIDTSMFKNNTGDPRNLQIYYSGPGNIKINVDGSQDFNGLIYAPNANISIGGNGNFNGALVGNKVDITLNGNMNLITDLSDLNSGGGGGGLVPTFNTVTSGGVTSVAVQGYRPTTFQEVPNLLVP